MLVCLLEGWQHAEKNCFNVHWPQAVNWTSSFVAILSNYFTISTVRVRLLKKHVDANNSRLWSGITTGNINLNCLEDFKAKICGKWKRRRERKNPKKRREIGDFIWSRFTSAYVTTGRPISCTIASRNAKLGLFEITLSWGGFQPFDNSYRVRNAIF